jgi:hypothetical protein
MRERVIQPDEWYTVLPLHDHGGKIPRDQGTLRRLGARHDRKRGNRAASHAPAAGWRSKSSIQTRTHWTDSSSDPSERPKTGDCTGPGYFQTDLAFYRTFRVTDAVKLQFRWDVFNDNTNFRGVNTVLQPSRPC